MGYHAHRLDGALREIGFNSNSIELAVGLARVGARLVGGSRPHRRRLGRTTA